MLLSLQSLFRPSLSSARAAAGGIERGSTRRGPCRFDASDTAADWAFASNLDEKPILKTNRHQTEAERSTGEILAMTSLRERTVMQVL